MTFSDLREFLGFLEEQGELARISSEVSREHQIAAYIRKTSDVGSTAFLFERVKGYEIPVAAGIFATERRAFLALGCQNRGEFVDKYTAAIDNLVPPRLVEQAPCQEVVQLGEDVDLEMLPVPVFSALDDGPYITFGIVITKDVDTGARNAGIYRVAVKGKNRLLIQAHAMNHVGMHLSRAEARGRPLQIAIAIGTDPAVPLASQWKAPYGVDELTLAGALRGKPLEVVKCKTVDLEVPATAEIVIEGVIEPGDREPEGPFGEFTGYYTTREPKPAIRVTALTHRRQPIYHAVLTGMPFTENHVLVRLACESVVFKELRGKYPGVKGVSVPPAGADLLVVASVSRWSRHLARNVLLSLLSFGFFKVAIVVDEDIDVHNISQVVWAVTTRGQFEQDALVIGGLTGAGLRSPRERTGRARLGIDATWKPDEALPELVRVPGVENVPDVS